MTGVEPAAGEGRVSPRRRVTGSETASTVLLLSLAVLLFVVYPFVESRGPGRLVVDLALSLVLVLGSYSLADRRWLLVAGGALAAAALVLRASGHLLEIPAATTASHGVILLFLAVAAGGVLSNVVREGPVTRHRIEGAVAVYLLLGLIWAFAFRLIEVVAPGSIGLPAALAGSEAAMGDLVHFSFATLTTLGYGDIVPLAPAARSLAALEALTGQLYLAILVARLVGLHLADRDSSAA